MRPGRLPGRAGPGPAAVVVDEEPPMSTDRELWRNAKGHEVRWRLVYHPGDLDTASHPSEYAQRATRAASRPCCPRTNLDIQQEIETAWRYADAMEAEAARRAKLAMADQLDCAVTITAKAAFRYAFVEGIAAARGQGIEYPNRERRLIGEVLEVCRFTFQPKQAEPS